jgi:hypothetical protein
MEMWELAKRILASANEGQSFTPSLAGSAYRRHLESLGESDLPSAEDVRHWAEQLAEQMEFVGLIEKASNPNRGVAILGAVRRTEFGDELYDALRGSNVVLLFQSMQATIDAGEIRRILHQLES